MLKIYQSVENLTIRGTIKIPRALQYFSSINSTNPMAIDGFYNQGNQNILFYREWESDIFPPSMTHSDTLFFWRDKAYHYQSLAPSNPVYECVVIT
jgi:hypothetical protein